MLDEVIIPAELLQDLPDSIANELAASEQELPDAMELVRRADEQLTAQ